MDKIDSFTGEYRWLSNFWLAEVQYDGDWYPSTEHAYQAAKTLDSSERQMIRETDTCGKAKRLGMKVTLREDWEEIKFEVMTEVIYDKFRRHADLREKLLDTGDAELIEGNNWGDRYWGVDGTGENNLGHILMAVRAELKDV